MKKNLLWGIIALTAVAFIALTLKAFFSGHRAYSGKANRPKLVVYTHSSFMSAYGPGPELAKQFEQICLCDVEFVNVGGAGLLKERLMLDKSKQVDVVVGIEHMSLSDIARSTVWKTMNLKLPPMNKNLEPIINNIFVPYNWAPMTFLYKKGSLQEIPKTVDEFFSMIPDSSLVLQDPQMSSPGLIWFYWLNSLKKDFASFYQSSVHKKVMNISPSWSKGYGLFKKGHADFVFTYQTSAVYHWLEENDQSYQPLEFADGHPMHIDYAGVPENCMSCQLAKRFVLFLTSPEAQKVIMEKNYMFPVVDNIKSGTSFGDLPELKILKGLDFDQFVNMKDDLIKAWKNNRVKGL